MYTIIVSDAEYIFKDGFYDWNEETGKDIKKVGEYETIKECFYAINNWGSRWSVYPSVFIENRVGEEIWSQVLSRSKCECCGNERCTYIEGGLYTMRNKDGSKLFSELV